MEVARKFCLSMLGKKKDSEDDVLCTFSFGNLMRVISLTLSSPSPPPPINTIGTHTLWRAEKEKTVQYSLCVWHFRGQGGSWPQGILIKKKS